MDRDAIFGCLLDEGVRPKRTSGWLRIAATSPRAPGDINFLS